MAKFAYNTVQWPGDDLVHIVWNSVWERSSRYALCSAVIGAGAVYDPRIDGKDVGPTCPACITRREREGDRWIAPLDKPVAPPVD